MTIRDMLDVFQNLPESEKDNHVFVEQNDGTIFMLRELRVINVSDHEILEDGDHYFTTYGSPTEPLS